MALPTKVKQRDDDFEIAYPDNAQQEIVLERREEVGRISLGNGPGSAITEAFRMAGEYMSEHLRDGSDNNITIEFSLHGMNFIARVES